MEHTSAWVETLHFDESEQEATILIEGDIGPLIERNRRLYNDTDGYSKSREWRHVASIPLLIVELWKKRYGADPLAKGNETLLRRLLNDPDLRFLRTSSGWM